MARSLVVRDPSVSHFIVHAYASARENQPTRERRDAAARKKNSSLSPPRLALLVWGDFHARSRFARSTIPEKKWGVQYS